jgi:hypothetical protein
MPAILSRTSTVSLKSLQVFAAAVQLRFADRLLSLRSHAHPNQRFALHKVDPGDVVMSVQAWAE